MKAYIPRSYGENATPRILGLLATVMMRMRMIMVVMVATELVMEGWKRKREKDSSGKE